MFSVSKGDKISTDYAKCAREIYEILGGRSVLVSAEHCATRLRIITADNDKIDIKKLEEIDGIKGVFYNNGQLQLIIGTGAVNKVYDEFSKISGINRPARADVKAAKQPLFRRMINAIGDVFVPILPAITASGFMTGLVSVLWKIIPSFAESGWYDFFLLLANASFSFLPLLLAISAAQVFGGNMFLGAVIGIIMIQPEFADAWESVSGKTAENLAGHLSGYQEHVIAVIAAVWLMCKIEKWLRRHIPEILDLFVTPLCTVSVTALITLGIMNPVFSAVEACVSVFARWVLTAGYGAGAMMMGAFYPLTVIFGIHHMYNVIEADMLLAPDGINMWMPVASAANLAQGAACLAVGFKTKNKKLRTLAASASFSAALGITEPAIFSVNVRYTKPLLCGMAGGAAGALTASFFHIGAVSFGVTGLPGFLITPDYMVQYAIVLVVSAGVSFVLTSLFWKEEPDNGNGTEQTEYVLFSPLNGNIIAREDIRDETFALGLLGDGVGIEPDTEEAVAPFDGKISYVSDAGHAVGISGPGGMEVLIHIGIDTVKMNGDGFELFVSKGEEVKAGQLLIRFDISKIKAAGYRPTTAVILTNSSEYPDFKIVKHGPAEIMDKLFMVG